MLITEESSLRNTAVLACVRILSNSVAMLPQSVYRRLSPRGKEEPGSHIHTDPTTEAQGVDLRALASALSIEQRVVFPDRHSYYLGYPAEYMALVYNAADVLLAASMTEGFGILISEAQACGTPVIVTDFASMPELAHWGIAVPPADLYWASGLESWWAWPDWRGIRDALRDAGCVKARSTLERRKAVTTEVNEQYTWDTVVERDRQPILAARAW